jgi:hypothetical protein
MTPEQTIGQMIVNEPVVQMAIVLSGVWLLWYEIKGIRKRLNTMSELTDRRAAINLCNQLIAARSKVLMGGAIAIQFGFCLLLASAKIFSAKTALSLLAILIFTTLIPATVYSMFWGVPAPLLRWLLTDLRLSPTNSP